MQFIFIPFEGLRAIGTGLVLKFHFHPLRAVKNEVE